MDSAVWFWAIKRRAGSFFHNSRAVYVCLMVRKPVCDHARRMICAGKGDGEMNSCGLRY